MEIRKAQLEDLPQMLAIYNYEVEHGVSTLDLQPKTLEERKEWFYDHNVENHPLYVAVVEGRVAGYVSLSKYREKEAYKSCVELSIYVSPDFRRRKVATEMMRYILEIAKEDERTHNVVSVITAGNEASRKLHDKFGFTFCGMIPEVGMKFNTYQGIENYSLLV